MTYVEAIQFLFSLRRFGATFGLSNTLKLARLASNPQEKLRFIHVAGTNGKGSTCAMLESIYRAAGLRVGLFTSPHLVQFGERIQVNRNLISETEIVLLLEQMQPWLREFSEAEHPTFFEIVTVMALLHFDRQGCDLVIWETGLGGRLDSTNIVTPLASVITNIALDHEKWLGYSLASIASEKAGIIKHSVPVVTAANEPEALEVIERIAKEKNSPLTRVDVSLVKDGPLATIQLPLPGEHQKLNAALAIATVQCLSQVIPVSTEQIRLGLSTTQWAGRLQLIFEPNGKKILLDGAHNPAGAITLRDAVNQTFAGEKPALILGILEDKNFKLICEILAPLADKILLIPVTSHRTTSPDQLLPLCLAANPLADVQICPDLPAALAASASYSFVIITGSLYLIGEALERLEGIDPSDSPGRVGANQSERALNEWTAGKVNSR